MEVFDEKAQECVLVVAPVLAIMCDNPRVSQIVGHMTGRPSKFCRVCLVCYLYTDIGYTAKTHTHGEFGKLEVCKYHALIWYTMALS